VKKAISRQVASSAIVANTEKDRGWAQRDRPEPVGALGIEGFGSKQGIVFHGMNGSRPGGVTERRMAALPETGEELFPQRSSANPARA
jgi:hypothetical protein